MEFLTFTPLLCLILVIPLMIAGYRMSLVDRPGALKLGSFLCRLTAVLLLVFALCRPFIGHRADDVHVVFLLDVSESVEPAEMRSGLAGVRAAMEALRKPVTRRSFKRTGLPSGVVSTAATNGVLPAAPRPRLPPERSPPM